MSELIDLSNFDPRLNERWASTFSIMAVPTRSISSINSVRRTLPIGLRCPNGHVYERSIGLPLPKTPRLGCTECEGAKVCLGINDLESQRPDLVDIWDHEKNTKLPSEISIYSNVRVYWHNKACGHKYDTKLGNQTMKATLPVSCPVCTFRILQSGVNDLRTLQPDLMQFWVEDNVLDPTQVFPETQKPAKWHCPRGGKHFTHVNIDYMVRTKGTSCRVCDGKELCVGVNDAASRLTHCLDEWDTEANGGVTLQDFQMAGKQAKSYWKWRCRENRDHSWEAMPIQRLSGFGKCPHCYKSRSTLEVEVFDWLKGIFPSAQRNNRSMLGERLELDVWLPDLRVGIEINGEFWHSERLDPNNKEAHDRKERLSKEKNITLIVLWEEFWIENRSKIKADLIEQLVTGRVKQEFTYQWRRDNPSKRELKEWFDLVDR